MPRRRITTSYSVEPQIYTDDFISLYELVDYYEKNKKHEIKCCDDKNTNKNKDVQFCDICDSTKPLHLLQDCIDLYILRKLNKPLRMNEDDIFNILKKHCRRIIKINNQIGYIVSSTQKEALDKEYRELLINNNIDPNKPFVYRSVTMYTYMNLGYRNETRESSFVTCEMVFDFIHPEILNTLIHNNII